jgi:hypothetical protein
MRWRRIVATAAARVHRRHAALLVGSSSHRTSARSWASSCSSQTAVLDPAGGFLGAISLSQGLRLVVGS